MPLSKDGYKRHVTGEDCRIVATDAIRMMLEQTMEERLAGRMRRHWKKHGPRSDRRNGYYERNLLTSWGWITSIEVPRGRVNSIAGEVIPRYQRRQAEFDAAVLSSFLNGHSTRKSTRFFRDFYAEMGVSHSTVGRILSRLDELAGAWLRRKLHKPYVYLWLDGKCAKIRNATKRPYSVLWAYGACEDGHRELLGFQIHYSEGTAHWESVLIDLIDRGLDPRNLRLVIRDENSGCEQAVLSLLGDVAQQSCAVHLERNIGKLTSKLNRSDFQSDVSQIFKENSLRAGRQKLSEVLENWERVEPEACLYLRANVDKSLVFYTVADNALWRTHLKSTNILERFFRELKRFEKHRQFRYADKASCTRFYYAYAKIYNEDHPRMPKSVQAKERQETAAYQQTNRLRSGPTTRPSKASGIQRPPKIGRGRSPKEVVRTQS
jgi:putative transposase